MKSGPTYTDRYDMKYHNVFLFSLLLLVFEPTDWCTGTFSSRSGNSHTHNITKYCLETESRQPQNIHVHVQS